MPESSPEKVEVVVEKAPREKPVTLGVTLKKDLDNNTIMYLLYLMYKSNMVSRVNLKQMFRLIDQPVPDEMVKWLLTEAAKA